MPDPRVGRDYPGTLEQGAIRFLIFLNAVWAFVIWATPIEVWTLALLALIDIAPAWAVLDLRASRKEL